MVTVGQTGGDLVLHACMFTQQNGARHAPHVDACYIAMTWNGVR